MEHLRGVGLEHAGMQIQSEGLRNNMFTICSMLEILALKIKHPLPSNNP